VASRDSPEHNPEYMHEWAARVSDPIEADLIAAETGFVNRGPIRPFHDIYLFENQNVPRRSKRHAQLHTERLQGHEKVLWAEQQVSKLRTKRDGQKEATVDAVLKFDKRAEASAYKSTHYDDPQWGDQWYLVSWKFFLSHMISFLALKTRNFPEHCKNWTFNQLFVELN
jgi:hypothetical protein